MKKNLLILLLIIFLSFIAGLIYALVMYKYAGNADAVVVIAKTVANEIANQGSIEKDEINELIVYLVERSIIRADISDPNKPKDLFGNEFRIRIEQNKITCESNGLFGKFFQISYTEQLDYK